MRPFCRSGNQCDCCSESFIDTLYACRNLNLQGRPVFTRPVGRWAVCYSCRRLLEDGNSRKLGGRYEKNADLYRALLNHIIPGQSWSVHQVKDRQINATKLQESIEPNTPNG
jgi:hypothetical protein